MNMLRVTWGMSAFVWAGVLVLSCMWWGLPATIVAIIFVLVPDLSLIGAFAEKGRMKTNHVRLYNSLHNMTMPVVLLGLGILLFFLTGGFNGGLWQLAIAGLAWFVHVAADRALGFGLRAPDGTMIPVGYTI